MLPQLDFYQNIKKKLSFEKLNYFEQFLFRPISSLTRTIFPIKMVSDFKVAHTCYAHVMLFYFIPINCLIYFSN